MDLGLTLSPSGSVLTSSVTPRLAQVTHVTTVHPPYRQYALKVLDKEHIKRERKTKYVLIERDTLKALDGHPGVIKLWWTFQDEWSLCESGSAWLSVPGAGTHRVAREAASSAFS